MNTIVYDCRWSSEADEKFINDFITVANSVFGGGFSKELFRKKYIDNIYGDSVVEVVYIDENPVAARGLWRNDIMGKPSYQPGDTCVTEVCRGRGIFTEMTKRSVEMLQSDAIVYNFPNQNSFPGYMKMGWKLINEYGFALFLGAKGYLKEHPVKMDIPYANWWLEGAEGLYSFKSGNEYFLCRRLNKFSFKVCACVEEEIAKKFPEKPVGICFYRSTKKTFYNKKLGLPLHVVSKNDIEYVPIWKIDVI